MKVRNAGFTLIEMAVSIFIIALLAGSILVPMVSKVEQRKISDTEAMLSEAREALLGFAAINRYLPCPDKATAAGPGVAAYDGFEDFGGGVCATYNGHLPTGTLGLNRQADAWGNRLRYRVVPAYAIRPPFFDLTTAANIRVCATVACNSPQTILTNFNPLAPAAGLEAVAVIVSHGPNGLGAIRYPGSTSNAAPTSAEELANLGAGNFISRPPSTIGSAAGEFDDIVVWLGRNQLYKVMISAGALP